MPTADLRALAGKLGLFTPCPLAHLNSTDLGEDCPVCSGYGQRLPTEAEVRVAIFEAGWTWMDIFVRPWGDEANVIVRGARRSDGPEREIRVEESEAAPDELVLLALLRALEACRG